MPDAMKTALDDIAARHGFGDAGGLALVVQLPTAPGTVLLTEVRHFSQHPVRVTHEIEDAHVQGMPTQTLLDAVEKMAITKRRLVGREAAMLQAGHTRLKTPYWALRAHRLGLLLAKHVGIRFKGDLVMNPVETDPTAPMGKDDGWKARSRRASNEASRCEISMNLLMQGDTLMFDNMRVIDKDADRSKTLPVIITCSGETTSLLIPGDLPDTVMSSLIGRDVGEVVKHPAWRKGAGVRVIGAEMDRDDDGWLDLTLEPVFEWMADIPEGVDGSWRS